MEDLESVMYYSKRRLTMATVEKWVILSQDSHSDVTLYPRRIGGVAFSNSTAGAAVQRSLKLLKFRERQTGKKCGFPVPSLNNGPRG